MNGAELNLNQNSDEQEKGKADIRTKDVQKDNIRNRSSQKSSIKIGTHNINGIKGDRLKVEQLAELGKEENFNIIGILETNIGEQEGK